MSHVTNALLIMSNGEIPAKARPLRRVSSLDLNLPELSEQQVEYTLTGEEVIPDSEEEQLRCALSSGDSRSSLSNITSCSSCKENRVLCLSHVEVIEISSDEDDMCVISIQDFSKVLMQRTLALYRIGACQLLRILSS
jgi:hypothetical protein